MGSTASTSHKGKKEDVPMWIYTAQVGQDQSQDKFAAISPGLQQLGPSTVARQRTGTFDTDGAQWKKGFTSGKHIFEVVFPMNHRGTDATIGVGHDDAPLHLKGRCSLVGQNKMSWGICLRTRRALHNNAIVKRYPQTQVFIPDKFFMYFDADSGSLQFGSDFDYYGTAHTGIPRGKALYPMVACTAQGATITMVYRGEATGEMPVQPPPPPPPPSNEPVPMAPPPPSQPLYDSVPEKADEEKEKS